MAEYPRPFPLGYRPPVRLVGLMGRARAGKDTVAARLIERYGFRRRAFADALKLTMLDLDPIVEVQRFTYGGANAVRLTEVVDAVGWEAAKDIPEVRRLLQAHGVAIREHADPDIWVRAVMTPADADPGALTVITDVRFPNEWRAIRQRGGLLVRVVRPGADGNGHVSEWALDDYEAGVTLVNAGTLADLHASIDLHLSGRIATA